MNYKIYQLIGSITLFLIVILSCELFAGDKISFDPNKFESDSIKVWISLTDKGDDALKLSKIAQISQKAFDRRQLRGADLSAQEYDLEINSDYLEQLKPLTNRIVIKSRWLNSVSAWVKKSSLKKIADLDFVKEIKKVALYIRQEPNQNAEDNFPLQKLASPEADNAYGYGIVNALLASETDASPTGTLLDYGSSKNQLEMIKVIDLHVRNLSGSGVTILMLDTGFRISLPVFNHLDIANTYDFIYNDSNVEDDDPSLGIISNQVSHGTRTLSVIGGFVEGNIIGVAYDATFLLGKTEVVATETQIEEDFWVAGLEWGESNGADLVSSSLGYTDWYNYSDLDGNTAVTTIAADIAAAHGMIIINSSGNDGRASLEPTLLAPADGDSVIAVGAVDKFGNITGFSSGGPTYDGRIKPDVVAQGATVRVAYSGGGYGTSSGTSFSCPLVAGVVALMLEAHPDWDFQKIYGNLTSTASLSISQKKLEVKIYPNPFQESINFDFSIPITAQANVRIYTVAGEKIADFQENITPFGANQIIWDGLNQNGQEVADGIYIVYITAPGIDEIQKIAKISSKE